jgi:endonuclease-3
MSAQNKPNTEKYAELRRTKYEPIAEILRQVYGDLQWSAQQSAMDELISCILSQSTTDLNRDRGFAGLKNRFPTWQDVVDAPTSEVVDAIRVAGLANQKAPRIQDALNYIYQERGEYNIDFLKDIPLDEAKAWLTQMRGIGPKTAAIVLCFAFGLPAFPVDTHVHRVGRRIGFAPEKMAADAMHDVMEAIVPDDQHYAFHIYLIQHGRDTCTARRAYCERCPLTAYCDYYANNHS